MGFTVSSGDSNILTLFSGLSGSNSGSLANMTNTIASLTTDYDSIRNGSYGKVTKAYYAKAAVTDSDDDTTTEKKKNLKADSVSSSSLEKVASKATNLESSVSALAKNSLYTESGYNADVVSDKVNSFVKSYNSLINEADSSSLAVRAKENKLTAVSESYESKLNAIGISINKDKTLSVDKNKLHAAAANDVAELFGKNAGFSSAVSASADSIASTATAENSTYNSSGSMGSSAGSVGSLFDSLY